VSPHAGMNRDDHPTILLVEDYDDARELYSTCLRSLGYHVIEAATGTAGRLRPS